MKIIVIFMIHALTGAENGRAESRGELSPAERVLVLTVSGVEPQLPFWTWFMENPRTQPNE